MAIFLITEGSAVFAFFFLTLHRYKTAYGKKSQCVLGFLALLFNNSRAHTYSEFVYLNAENFSKDKMTEFVNSDYHPEKQYSYKNRNNFRCDIREREK